MAITDTQLKIFINEHERERKKRKKNEMPKAPFVN